MRFRKAYRGPLLSRDERNRQGRVVTTAHLALAGVEEVRTFLNSHHDGLCGRPLDLAVASDAGLAAVEMAIRAEAGRAANAC